MAIENAEAREPRAMLNSRFAFLTLCSESVATNKTISDCLPERP